MHRLVRQNLRANPQRSQAEHGPARQLCHVLLLLLLLLLHAPMNSCLLFAMTVKHRKTPAVAAERQGRTGVSPGELMEKKMRRASLAVSRRWRRAAVSL